jgi:hypothetical protein
MDSRPPPLASEWVQAFVIAGHGDLDQVNRMLDAHPALINASWDWGGGDYETALGGAAHVGQRAIAHSLSLLFHAGRCGDEARAVVDYL